MTLSDGKSAREDLPWSADPAGFAEYLASFFAGPFAARDEAVLAAGRRFGEVPMICGGRTDGWWIRPWHPQNYRPSDWPASFRTVSREEVALAGWSAFAEGMLEGAARPPVRLRAPWMRISFAPEPELPDLGVVDFSDWLDDMDLVDGISAFDGVPAFRFRSDQEEHEFFVMLSESSARPSNP